ncbi:MAG: hypothetical protein HQL26_10890, partial [Candidatus Omnitrophica bacterium]|nr:hypothetical protein [Candidatus Omnitrophota bacterium]
LFLVAFHHIPNSPINNNVPEHGVDLVKKYIMYGFPCPGEKYDNVILGGCCVSDDSPEFGYECPQGKEVYFLINGKLILDAEPEDDGE